MPSAPSEEWPRRVAILGVGLLGGSVAKSIRRLRPKTQFVGLARSAEKQQRLQSLGWLDDVGDSVSSVCQDCDVVVVAAPVDRIAELVLHASDHLAKDALITDVGSTKAGIVAEVERSKAASNLFVAAHPIAGSEKSGAEFAVETLFDGKTIVITPGEDADESRVQKADLFWRLTGGLTTQMSPAEHDAHLAAVSHVPHFVSALVATMARPEARPLVGSGWQDITRVAAGDPTMWTAICKENRAAIEQELIRFRGELDRVMEMIVGGHDQALQNWLAKAKNVKEQAK